MGFIEDAAGQFSQNRRRVEGNLRSATSAAKERKNRIQEGLEKIEEVKPGQDEQAGQGKKAGEGALSFLLSPLEGATEFVAGIDIQQALEKGSAAATPLLKDLVDGALGQVEGRLNAVAEREIYALSSYLEILSSGEEFVLKAASRYLGTRLLRALADMESEMVMIEEAAGDLQVSTSLVQRAERLLPGEGQAENLGRFERAAESLRQARRELEFAQSAYETAERASPEYTRNAERHLENALRDLPCGNSFSEVVGLVGQAIGSVRRLKRYSDNYEDRMGAVKDSYAEALYMAWLIRFLPRSIHTGSRLIELMSMSKRLGTISDRIRERERQIEIFLSGPAPSKVDALKTCTEERKTVEGILADLKGMDAFLQAASRERPPFFENLARACENPILTVGLTGGEPDLTGVPDLAEIEQGVSIFRLAKNLKFEQRRTLAGEAKKLRFRIIDFRDRLRRLRGEIRRNLPDSAKTRQATFLVKETLSWAGVEDPLMSVATGSAALGAASRLFGPFGDEEGQEAGGAGEGGGKASQPPSPAGKPDEKQIREAPSLPFTRARSMPRTRREIQQTEKADERAFRHSTRSIIEAIHESTETDERLGAGRTRLLHESAE